MKTQSLISSSLAMILAATPSIAFGTSGTNQEISGNHDYNNPTNIIEGKISADSNQTNNINFNGTTNTIKGKIWTHYYSTNNITFNGDYNKVEKSSDKFVIHTHNNGTANITFEKGINEIIGEIHASQQSTNTIKLNGTINIITGDITTDNQRGSTNNITFEKGINTITGGISANGPSGTNNITFKGDTNTIKGNIFTQNYGYNNITFEKGINEIIGNIETGANQYSFNTIIFNGTTNTITGKIKSWWHGNNTITFNGDHNKIVKGSNDYAIVTGTSGNANITFKKGINEIIGGISNESSCTQGTSGHCYYGTTNITFEKGTIENTITGEIKSDYQITNNINLNGTTNTITGKINTGHGSNNITFNGDYNKIEKGSSNDYAIYANNHGTSNITFEGGINEIIGEIKTDNNGTNNISLKGNNSTLTIDGEITTTNGKTELSLQANKSKLQLTKAIKANGGTTHLTISGSNSTLTAQKLETSSNGKLDVSFTGNNSTLRLAGSKHQISTLKSDKGVNKLIDLSSSSSASSFTLLEIGTKNGSSSGSTGTEIIKGEHNFKVYADPTKQNGKLGDQTSQSNRDSNSTNYGNVYSDRVVLHGKANTNQSLLVVIDPNDITKIHYTENKGTEQAGNIAVATIKKESNESIDFVAKEVINGGERIQVKLKKVETDENGKVTSTSSKETSSSQKTYYTYFLDSAQSLGADTITQKLVASALATNYDLYLANFNSLNKRMGELRNNPKDKGVWARVFGGAQESKFGVGSQTQYITIQGGYDYKMKVKNANNYMGFALSYAYSSGKSKKVERAHNDASSNQAVGIDDIRSNGFEVAIYNSFVSDVGWYNDTIAKFSHLSSSFILDQSPEKSKTTNYALTLSNEVGYRYVFGEKQDYYIDPQVELGLGYVNQSDFKSKLIKASASYNNLSAIQNHLLMLRTRAGASLGKIIYGEKNAKASLYFGAFYEYDFVDGGENKITLGSGTTTTNLGSLTSNGRVVLNLGSNININDNTRMYVDVEKSFGDKLRTHLQFNLGARYSF